MDMNTFLIKKAIKENGKENLKDLFLLFDGIEQQRPSNITDEQAAVFVEKYGPYCQVFTGNFMNAVIGAAEIEREKISTKELCFLISYAIQKEQNRILQ